MSLWGVGATAQNVTDFPSVQIQVAGLSGGDTIAITRSIDGDNYVAQSLVGSDFTVVTSISANGIYSAQGGGFIKYAKTGSASTPAVSIVNGG